MWQLAALLHSADVGRKACWKDKKARAKAKTNKPKQDKKTFDLS